MENDANLPVILNGKFFKIVSENADVIVAKCMNCVNKSISGSRRATTNFLRHVKVGTITTILRVYERLQLLAQPQCSVLFYSL
jgi:hypothetical protein